MVLAYMWTMVSVSHAFMLASTRVANFAYALAPGPAQAIALSFMSELVWAFVSALVQTLAVTSALALALVCVSVGVGVCDGAGISAGSGVAARLGFVVGVGVAVGLGCWFCLCDRYGVDVCVIARVVLALTFC